MVEGLPDDRADGTPAYMDEGASQLPGWPGFRNRPGRSGLDYLDNEFELAHMEGLFLRRLFTGKLRTTNPLYLAVMGILGVLCLVPAILVLPSGSIDAVCPGLCYFMPLAGVGLALLVNLAVNLRNQ